MSVTSTDTRAPGHLHRHTAGRELTIRWTLPDDSAPSTPIAFFKAGTSDTVAAGLLPAVSVAGDVVTAFWTAEKTAAMNGESNRDKKYTGTVSVLLDSIRVDLTALDLWVSPIGFSGSPSSSALDLTVSTGDLTFAVSLAVGGDPAGSAAAAQAAAIAAAAIDATSKVAVHSADTTAVHGIADTSLLETTTGAQAKVDAHASDTTAVHGITDTSVLETTSGAQAKVDAAITALIGGAPGALDTLNELAAALGDDASYAASITSALAGKQPLDSDLTAIAALSTTSYGRAFLALADAAAGRTALELGTAAITAASAYDPAGSAAAAQAASQPVDSDLTAIAALGTTEFGRAFLALADASAVRETLGPVNAGDISAPTAEQYFGTAVLSAILNIVGAALPDRIRKTGGGGRDIVTQENVSGQVILDLALGSVQRIDGSTDVHSFVVEGASSSGEINWSLFSNATHAPTWFAGATGMDFSKIVWDGREHEFTIRSINGGSTSLVRDQTPTARVYEGKAFGIAGVLTTGDRTGYPDRNKSGIDRDLVGFMVTLDNDSASTSVIIDAYIAGTTVFITTTKPTLATGTSAVYVALAATDNFEWDADADLTYGVDQTDGTAAGLTVTPHYIDRAYVAPTPDPNPTINIVYSTSGYESPLPLHAATVAGDIVPWLDNNEAEIERTYWFMDTAALDATLEAIVLTDGEPDPPLNGGVRGDSTVPFNLKGGQATPNAWDTLTDPTGNGRPEFAEDGVHTLKVAVRFADQTTVIAVATFTIDNNVTPPAQLPQVPAGLASSAPADGQAQWTWTATPNGVGGFDDTVSYEIRVNNANPPTAGTIVTATSPHLVTGLDADTWYAQVRGVDADGDRSDWSTADGQVVTAPATGFDAVTSWVHFYPAGDGVTAQPNSLLAGLVKGTSLEIQPSFTDELQYPQRGWAWSSPEKVNLNFAGAIRNLIDDGTTSSAVGREANLRSQSRIRKTQAPENGGFGADLGDGDYGAGACINFVISQRKHNAKQWKSKKVGGVTTWSKPRPQANETTKLAGYTPGLPVAATNAEDSVVAYGLLLSGALDTKLAALAVELIDNRSGDQAYGYWAQAVAMRFGWEMTAPWSSDFSGITPNLIGSSILQNVSTGSYGLPLNARAKELIGAITDAGDPKYEVFIANAALDAIPGWREVVVGGSNPDFGTGGDLSILAAEAYIHVFDLVANEMADRCDLRGIAHIKPFAGPNLAHPGATPEGDDDTQSGPVGWAGTGGAPDGGDLYDPYEQSKQFNLRYFDTIGRDRMAFVDMDFYGRNSLLTDWTVEVPAIRSQIQSLVLRYLRPFASSECGWTASSGTQYTKDNAPVDRLKLAGFLDAIHNPITGLIASVPTSYIVHYIPDGNADGVDRYRLNKTLDDVGSPNPWDTLKAFFPGRLTNRTDFVGQS